MMKYQQLTSHVIAMKRVEDIEALKKEFTSAILTLGFSQFAYARFRASEFIHEQLIHTYSEAWIMRYIDQKYDEIDPVFKLSSEASGPIFWSADDYLEDPDLATFFQEASQFGIHQGITCPMRSASTKRAFLTVAAAATPGGLDAFIDNPKLHVTLNTLAQVFHQKAIEFSTVYDHEVKDRERQVLQLSSWGLTTEDMSAFLELNKDYVNEVVASAIVRLGVNNRVSAVQRARDMGYIE